MTRPVAQLDPAGTLAGIYMALTEITALLRHVDERFALIDERLDLLEQAVFDAPTYPPTVDITIRDGLL